MIKFVQAKKWLLVASNFGLNLVVLFVFVLSPVAHAAMNQSAFRFLSNMDNANPTFINSNASSADESVGATAIDTVNANIFIGGNNATWLIEKRSEIDGGLVSAFGTNGLITQDITGNSEEIAGIAAHNSDGSIFVAGSDRSVGASNAQWRIEKRDYVTGALISGFGTSGVVTSNPTSGNDIVTDIVLDKLGGYIYISGYDSTGGNQWRIEKRTVSTGALVSAFGTSGAFTLNPSNQDDRVRTLRLDPTATYIYVVGSDEGNGNTQWRVDKRRASDAAACTAANCGTLFGTAGTYTSNPSNRADDILSLQVDDAGGAIYLGGYDGSVGNNNAQWRIEKIDLSTGALITGFGTNGVVTTNPSSNNDAITGMSLDGAGGFIYIVGYDNTSNDMRWRVEKRQRSSGALVSAFGTSGVVTSNPSSNNDQPYSIDVDVDRNLLFGIGMDRVPGSTNQQWRIEQYQTDTGGYWLANANTIAVASTNITFRLRMLLHTDADLLSASNTPFKLQTASKVGTCDTSFVGESYADIVQNTGEVQYHNNPSLADGATAVAVSGDPTHSGHTNILQTIEELNNFTNPTTILSGQDGLWDFVLKDNSAFGAYCFRAVNGDGSTLGGYTTIPEITFCKDDPKTDNLLRGGAYFCEGIKRSYFWAKE